MLTTGSKYLYDSYSTNQPLISIPGWPWFRSFASGNKLVLILSHSLINDKTLIRHSNRPESEKRGIGCM